MEILTTDTIDGALDYALEYNDTPDCIREAVKNNEGLRSRLIDYVFKNADLLIARTAWAKVIMEQLNAELAQDTFEIQET